ncbi:MAG: hypothetical protein OEL78_00500 [Hyphomicrobiales bacterium]|nr:hypothetical protein [Hyphomicrobiales bacterium]
MKLIFVPVLLSGVTATQCETMEEALDVARRFAPKAKRVFLEPKGTKTLKQLPKRDMILVLGNTETGNAEHAKPSEMYGIKSVGETDLYGVNAAAIALAVRHEYG